MSIDRPTTASTAERLLGGSIVHADVARAANAATIATAHALESIASSMDRLTEYLTAEPAVEVATALLPPLEALDNPAAVEALTYGLEVGARAHRPSPAAVEAVLAVLADSGLFIARRGGQS